LYSKTIVIKIDFVCQAKILNTQLKSIHHQDLFFYPYTIWHELRWNHSWP